MTDDTTTTRVVIYTRVSTPKEIQLNSLDNQAQVCRALCERNEWQVVAVESDTHTAYQQDSMEKRRGWQRVIRLCMARRVDVVLVQDRSRCARNRRDFEDFEREILQRYDVRLVPAFGVQVDPENIYTEFAAEDEVRDAERFSRTLSHKVRNGRAGRLRDGFWSTYAPYGCRAGRVKGIPEKHPGNWPVLEKMFALADAGMTHGEIRRWLNDQGHTTSRGARFTITRVKEILNNPFYVGEVWRDGEVYQLRHECLVDRDLWDRVQENIGLYTEAQAQDRGGRPRDNTQGYVYLLPRVVTSHYVAKGRGGPLPLYGRWCRGRGGRYPYYYRADKMCNGPDAVSADGTPLFGAGSVRTAVRADYLDATVVRQLIRISGSAGWLDYELRSARDQRLEELAGRIAEAERAAAKAGELRTKARRASARLALEEGLVETIQELDEQAAEYAEEQLRQDQLLNRYRTELDHLRDGMPDIERARGRFNAIKTLWEEGAMEELSAVLDLVVDYLDLRTDTPKLVLKPVMQRVRKIAPTGVEPVTPP